MNVERSRGELVLDALACGVLGGSVVALFFLVVDHLDGRPLFTPSLMGSVFFFGMAADAVTEVRLDAVIYFSIAHIAAFTALGAAITLLVHEVELHARHPVVVLVSLFVVLEVAFFVVAPVVLSGVMERLGTGRIAVANLLAAATIALYFVFSHRARTWQKLVHTTAELVLDAFATGVLGGSVVALFFLVVDLMDGQPFFTPTLMGSVIFQGAAADAIQVASFDAVVYFSIVHVAAFAALGAAISLLVHEVELHARHPFVILVVLFAVIEVSFFAAAPVLLPGVIERLGIGRVATANLLAATTIALYFAFSHRAHAWHQLRHTSADMVFDSFYSGAIGGSVVALCFLTADLLEGQPLFTPSLMGSVLFFGVDATAFQEVRLDAVAYFSIVHMAAFGVLGAVITLLVHEAELHARHPVVVLLVLFAVIEVSFFAAAPLVLPGVIERLGVVRVGLANLLAAVSIAVFFWLSHRPENWQKVKSVAQLAWPRSRRLET